MVLAMLSVWAHETFIAMTAGVNIESWLTRHVASRDAARAGKEDRNVGGEGRGNRWRRSATSDDEQQEVVEGETEIEVRVGEAKVVKKLWCRYVVVGAEEGFVRYGLQYIAVSENRTPNSTLLLPCHLLVLPRSFASFATDIIDHVTILECLRFPVVPLCLRWPLTPIWS